MISHGAGAILGMVLALSLPGCKRGQEAGPANKPQEVSAAAKIAGPATQAAASATQPAVRPVVPASQPTQAATAQLEEIAWQFVSMFPRQSRLITITPQGKLRSVYTRENKSPQIRESQLTSTQMRGLAALFARCVSQPPSPNTPTDVRILIRYGERNFEGFDPRCEEVNKQVQKLAAASPLLARARRPATAPAQASTEPGR